MPYSEWRVFVIVAINIMAAKTGIMKPGNKQTEPINVLRNCTMQKWRSTFWSILLFLENGFFFKKQICSLSIHYSFGIPMAKYAQTIIK